MESGLHNGLLHAHSGLRWVLLVLLVTAIAQAFGNKGKALTNSNRKIAMFAMIFTHIQLLIGLVLYFLPQSKNNLSEPFLNAATRFYTVEHLVGMLIAIALITIGHSKAKKSESFKPIATYYLIGLIIILASIPWPFREGLAGGWF